MFIIITLLLDGCLRVYTVRGGGIDPVADQNAISNGDDIDIQVVVDHVQVVLRGQRSRDSVNPAREITVGGAEWGFPDLEGKKKTRIQIGWVKSLSAKKKPCSHYRTRVAVGGSWRLLRYRGTRPTFCQSQSVILVSANQLVL